MHHRRPHWGLAMSLVALVVLLGAGSVLADEHPSASKEHPGAGAEHPGAGGNEADMMKVYMEAAKPGSEHAMLAKSAGSWKVTMKSWMDPSGEPVVSEGSETAKMILGGRFLQSNTKGEGMMGPFEGMGLLGYDNVTGKYVGNWCDSMGTGLMNYEGDYDAQKKELVCTGDFVDAATKMTMKARMVSRFISDDEHVFEMYGPGPTGDEVKWMEMHYTRVK